MIPILYEAGETAFATNGLGRLSDATYCVVTEERNGEYELEMEYPITGSHYSDIREDRLIYVKPAEDANPQAFRIYKISRPISGIVTINAEHISYMLNKIPVMPFTANSCASAISLIASRAAFTCPFTFWTDKTVTGDFVLEEPRSARSILGGDDPSILSVYGKGDYEFDNFTVKLHLNRGLDRGVTLRYGKNITNLTNEIDLSETYTGIVPFWKGNVDEQEVIVFATNNVVWATGSHADEYAYRYAKVVDFSQEFDEQPTPAQLDARAATYLADNEGWKFNQNIKVSFVDLWKSEEYKDIAPLEKVRLCDTVTVIYPKLDVNVKMKVVKTVFDVLKDRYNEIELGEPQTNLSKAINDTVNTSKFATKTDLAGETSYLQQALDHQTQMITGGLGGYCIFKYNANDQPEELLVLDNLDINQAVNVIRINKNGIGFSHNGYNGPFATAWTIDGNFSADFITTGSLLASLIKTGKIESHDGSVYFDLDGDEIVASKLMLPGSSSARYSTFLGLEPGGFYLHTSSEDPLDGLYFREDRIYYNRDFEFFGQGYNHTSYTDPWHSFNVYASGVSIVTQLPSPSTGYARLSVSPSQYGGGTVTADGNLDVYGNVNIQGTLSAVGTKSRIADTENYNKRLLYCYEMPSPMFGDIGEGMTDEHGLAYISIDDIFDETVRLDMEYQVFLQKEARGELWVQEKTPNYFTVCGDANLKFSWELKAKQKGYEYERLEDFDSRNTLDAQNDQLDLLLLNELSNYEQEQEDLLYETA